MENVDAIYVERRERVTEVDQEKHTANWCSLVAHKVWDFVASVQIRHSLLRDRSAADRGPHKAQAAGASPAPATRVSPHGGPPKLLLGVTHRASNPRALLGTSRETGVWVYSLMGERLPCKKSDGGSNPLGSTRRFRILGEYVCLKNRRTWFDPKRRHSAFGS